MVKTGKQAGKIVGAVAKICGGVGGGPTDYSPGSSPGNGRK
jgi:hypothetical protein